MLIQMEQLQLLTVLLSLLIVPLVNALKVMKIGLRAVNIATSSLQLQGSETSGNQKQSASMNMMVENSLWLIHQR